jgi:hypothetical protein
MEKKLPVIIKFFLIIIPTGILTYVIAEDPFKLDSQILYYITYNAVSIYVIYILTNSVSNFLNFELNSTKNKTVYLASFWIYLSAAVFVQGTNFLYYKEVFWLTMIIWILPYILFINSNIFFQIDKSASNDSNSKNINEYLLNDLNLFEKILISIAAIWTISIAYITISNIIFYKEINPTSDLINIYYLLDFRFIPGILFIILIIIKGVIQVAQEEKKINPKDLLTIDNKPFIKKENPFKNTFKQFIQITSNGLKNIINALYKVIALVVLYLKEIGSTIYKIGKNVLKKSFRLVFYILGLVFVVITFLLVKLFSKPLLDYILLNEWSDSYLPFLKILGYGLVIIFSVIAVRLTENLSLNQFSFNYNKDRFIKSINSVFSSLPFSITIFWILGMLLFGLSLIESLNFSTFNYFGIYSSIITLVVLIGFLNSLISEFKPKNILQKKVH